MKASEHKAFEHSSIFEYYSFVSRHSFFISASPSPVEIVVEIRENNLNQFEYVLSHHIKTEDQAGPYVSSRRTFETPGQALEKAVKDITGYYDLAVRGGATPSTDWFVASRELT